MFYLGTHTPLDRELVTRYARLRDREGLTWLCSVAFSPRQYAMLQVFLMPLNSLDKEHSTAAGEPGRKQKKSLTQPCSDPWQSLRPQLLCAFSVRFQKINLSAACDEISDNYVLKQ